MNQEESHRLTVKCFNGELASCSYPCPFRFDIRSFMEKVQRGGWSAAYRLLRDATVFPDIACEICDHPCEEHCVRGLVHQGLSISAVEKACLRYVKSKEPSAYNIPAKSERIAVVGAGISGLACALRLAVKKYNVTVFDAETEYGGTLKKHLSAEAFMEDIERQFRNERVEFRFGTRVTTIALEGFDAIYVATGSGGDGFGLMDSWDEISLSTAMPNVYLGGMLCGATPVQSIEHGIRAARQIEKYLLTGKTPVYVQEHPYENCNRYINADDATGMGVVKPASVDGYTQEEAIAEAKRCLKCDCTGCIDRCEMLKYYRKKPKKISKEIYEDSNVLPGLTKRTLTRQLSACNICGHCKQVCPTGVDMGAAALFYRRDRLAHGNYPAVFHEFWLAQMELAHDEASVVKLPYGQTRCGYLFFPGCQLGASDPRYVSESYEKLLEIKSGDVGLMLTCCGAPAYWAGDEPLHEEIIHEIREGWERMGRPVVILACATCAKLFAEYLPEVPTKSLYKLLDAAGMIGQAPFAGATVFDPCASREDEEMRESIRALARRSGVTLSELPFRGETAKCCGWGGHTRIANKELHDRVVADRINASEEPYIVYCANCRDTFAAKGKECVHILDVVFGLGDGSQAVPTIKEKRYNQLSLKREMLMRYWNEDYELPIPPGHELLLNIPEKIRQKMEELLISEDFVRAAIANAQATDEWFDDVKNGVFICTYAEGECTLWVHCDRTGMMPPLSSNQKFTVFNVYTHRMKVLE